MFVLLVFMQDPTYALDTSGDITIQNLHTNLIAALKYEVKEPTSLENPVTDPNFNVMRNKEIGKSRAIPLVVGILIIAIVILMIDQDVFFKKSSVKIFAEKHHPKVIVKPDTPGNFSLPE